MIYKSFISLTVLCSFSTQICTMATPLTQILAQKKQLTPAELNQKLLSSLSITDEREFFFIIDALLRLGANIDAQDENGNTLLMLAAKNKRVMSASILSFLGARSDIDNNQKETFGEIASITMIREVKQARLEAAKQPISPQKP